jgi:hypothetical protein
MNSMRRLLSLAPLLVAGCVFPQSPDAWVPGVNPVPPEHIVELKKSGVADATIWRDVGSQGLLRHPTSDELIAMKQAGSSDEFIRAVAKAPVRVPEPARPVYHAPPPGYHESNAAISTFVAIAGIALLYGAAWACYD